MTNEREGDASQAATKNGVLHRPGWWRLDIARPHERPDGIPTRICLDWHTEAEQAITAAMYAVERAGGSLKLTEAVNLLSKARD